MLKRYFIIVFSPIIKLINSIFSMTKSNKNRNLHSVNYTMFYNTACYSINQIRDQNRFFEKNDITLDDESTVRGILYNTEMFSIITIVFCAMTLESFINHYGSEKFTKPCFDECLDNLDLKTKWVKIPKLVTGKQIDKEGKAFNLFSNLIKLRNILVHDKIKIKSESLPAEREFLWESDANESIECVKLMIAELKKIDNTIYTDWIL